MHLKVRYQGVVRSVFCRFPPNTVMEIQGYCDKETQYRNTSAIHHASDLAFEPTYLDVEPRLHRFVSQ
jgi:hypothetical protein